MYHLEDDRREKVSNFEMDFEQAFVACIKDGKKDGIKALGIDKYTANEVFVCDTPLKPEQAQRFPVIRRPTPLVYSILCKQHAISEYLIELGADVHQTVLGWHPIHFAALESEVSIIDAICKVDASEVNAATDDYKATALHIAVSNGLEQAVRQILCLGADVNQANAHGETALHMASVCTNTNIIEMLLAFGADVTLKNDRQLTPQDLANNKSFTANVTILERAKEHPELLPTKESLIARNDMSYRNISVDDDNEDDTEEILEHLELLEQRLDALEEEVTKLK